MFNKGLLRKQRATERDIDRLKVIEVPLYDTNTFTPTYFGSATAGTTTYTVQQGAYIRLGNAICFTLTMTWTAATGTGFVRVGLPFTAASTTNQNFTPAVYTDNVTFANGSVDGLIQPGASSIRLFSPITNAGHTELAIEAAGSLVISGWYLI